MRVKMVAAGPASALILMVSLLLVMVALPASAQTTGVGRMEENAGWTCIDFGLLGIHCFNGPSAALFDGERTSVPARVFTVDEGGNETYQGTELLLRADVFERDPNGERPCPQEGGHWHDLSTEFGLPYYGCHHYGSSD